MYIEPNRLKELRRRKALSVRELAARAGLSTDVIYRVETGRSGAHGNNVRALAAALGVEVEELTALEEGPDRDRASA